jgi:adenosylmethionine-8-amino-7-oxononanoate aminotransferase
MNERARPETVGSTPTLENSPYFMPFSMNRAFKKAPRMLARAEGMYYYTPEGRKVLDGTSGLWCVNAGHCRKPIVEAVHNAVATLDFAPSFQMGHPAAFEFAEKLFGRSGNFFIGRKWSNGRVIRPRDHHDLAPANRGCLIAGHD